MKIALIPMLLFLCLAGCTAGIVVISNHGIKYEIPASVMDKSSADSSKDTYSFTSPALTFSEKNGKLTVNGKDFGIVKAGDTVAIDGKGQVSVNGVPRSSI